MDNRVVRATEELGLTLELSADVDRIIEMYGQTHTIVGKADLSAGAGMSAP
jgi:hypothetical protein